MGSFLKYYEILLQKAGVDLRSATVLYNDFQKGNSELDLAVIFFHLQQAAEKCLKDVLTFNRIYYPKVHDLEVLLNVVFENEISLLVNSTCLTDLSDFAVEGRYSVIHDDIVNTENYFEEVNQLLRQVSDLLKAK